MARLGSLAQRIRRFGPLTLLLLGGCSFHSQDPAPVESLYTGQTYRERPKGSLQGQSYRVQPGDTLYSIAWASDQDFRSLAERNNLSAPYLIRPGQMLRLSGSDQRANNSSTAPTPRPAPAKPRAGAASTGQVAKTPTENQQIKPVDPASQPSYSGSASSQTGNKPGALSTPRDTALPDRVAKWRWPVQGKIVRRFSATEQGNKGLDIAAAAGTPVRSAAEGRVVYAGSALRGYGKLIIIKHSDEYLSAYAHNRRILVEEKQRVSAGQQIAEVGNSDADRAMLHFEIRYKGKSVDPLHYLPRK
ncbi:peptidoglycan DD-metalloendopeptidase family protein [Ferrimonas balearica]|uniref:peptidoglycan DD-metalloendopeptidase family protein n=1 Tax=Ferrimonas balearica TaxID=44012 RepID=UPI001C99A618|nr:peptidoglycan DD-metalloendopeptidase family protein [Ferrimonas balearica]MBY5990555.1 peptidoglycan DD-metalloendopeptidase family protein [Ferrimonas balearica]